MNSADILALPPGPALDQAVHTFVFGGIGPLVPYSTDDREGAKIIDRMPVFVGRVDPSHPKFDPTRQFVAGVLAWEASLNGDVTRIRVTGSTRLSTLCRAALLVVFRPARADRPAPASRTTSEQAARDVAARVGTPGARNAAAGIQAAREAAEKRTEARAKHAEKAAKKAARLAGVPYVPASAANPTIRATVPVRTAPRPPQPAVSTTERAPRPPMPARPKEFIPPQPVDSGGNDKTP